ncbi:MAG: hypothetical protein M0Z66_06630 [Thermaerobacter sp.]|nr:hypothetical protein [Thermaerobacter sp.]
MFMRLLATLLAGLGLTLGGLSLNAHSTLRTRVQSGASTHPTGSSGSASAAVQSQSAALANSGAGLSHHGQARVQGGVVTSLQLRAADRAAFLREGTAPSRAVPSPLPLTDSLGQPYN